MNVSANFCSWFFALTVGQIKAYNFWQRQTQTLKVTSVNTNCNIIIADFNVRRLIRSFKLRFCVLLQGIKGQAISDNNKRLILLSMIQLNYGHYVWFQYFDIFIFDLQQMVTGSCSKKFNLIVMKDIRNTIVFQF